MNSNQKRTCFISYPWSDSNIDHVIRNAVLPALRDAGWEVLDPRFLSVGGPIFDWIAQSIRKADLIIADISIPNQNISYELGMAHGWGKRSILISQSTEQIPFDIGSRYQIFLYTRSVESIESLRSRIFNTLNRYNQTRISLRDPSIDRIVSKEKSISIELFRKDMSPVQSFRYVYQVIDALDHISVIYESSIAQIKVGSLGAWISSNLKTITSLVEKIIFFIPEYRLRNSNRLKIDAETQAILAQAEKTRAEANKIRNETSRKNVKKLLETMEFCQKVGPSKVTIGDRLFLETNENGLVKIGVPQKYDEMEGI